jgi:arabinofuranosyltransferase
MANTVTHAEMSHATSDTSSRPDRDTMLSFAVLGAALALFVVLARQMAPYMAEDAFISYRYAENLGSGLGLTYNPQQPPVEGYSNLLWILIAASVRGLGGSIEFWMPRLGVLTGMLTVLVVWSMYRRRDVSPARMAVPLALLVSSGPLMLYTVSGFETPLFALLLIVLLSALDGVFRTNKPRHWAAMTLAGVLLFLSRPEGVVVFPAVVGLMFLQDRRSATSDLDGPSRLRPTLLVSAVFVLSFGAYLFWRTKYFNELLPAPFLSKAGAGSGLSTAWSMNSEMYFDRQGFDENAVAPLGYYYLALLFAACAGALASGSRMVEKRTEVSALVLGLGLSLVYVNFVDWYPAMRYHSALTPLFFLPGVWLGGSGGGQERPGRSRAGRLRLAAIGLALFAINFGVFKQVRMEALRSVPLHARLVSLGAWLNENAPEGAVLATPDVGMVPYYAGLQTVDIHPEALVDMHIAREGFSMDYFFSRDPSFVLLTSRRGDVFRDSDRMIASDPRFVQEYRLLGMFGLGWFENLGYRVYAKNSISLSEDQVARLPAGIAARR